MYETIEQYEATLSDQDKVTIARGEHLHSTRKQGFIVEDRILGMGDIFPMKAYRIDQAIRKVIQNGCCGVTREVSRSGICWVTEMECPLYKKVRTLQFKMFGKEES